MFRSSRTYNDEANPTPRRVALMIMLIALWAGAGPALAAIASL